jgi:DNA-binding beta-propeller fold protein YncE
MSYTEYLRRKEAAAPKVIDTTLRLDASSYTQRVKFASSRMINETNLKEFDQVVPTVSTFAGSTYGYLDGIGTAAQFRDPWDICIDSSGTNMYVIDQNSFKIRKIVISTRQVSTLAGSTNGYLDGIGTAAQFSYSTGICIDPAGLNLYICEQGNHKIRKVVISTGEVSTLAGSTSGFNDAIGTSAQFNNPQGICIDPTGLNLYVGDQSNDKIRKVVISTGEVTTFAGSTSGFNDAIGTSAQFNFPSKLCIDSSGTNLYVTDSFNNRIRKIVISTRQVSTLAGSTSGYLDGIGTAARFNFVYGISIDSSGTNLYVIDQNNNRIRKIVIATGEVSTFAGSTIGYLDGIIPVAQFNSYPRGLTIDSSGTNMYIADSNNSRIRKITPLSDYYPPIISINKTKAGGRIPDASTFTQYAGGQAVGKEVQAGMPARRLLLNSNSAGSLTGCRIVPEPIPYNPAVGGVYTANMVPRDASQFTRDETACRELTGEPHNRNELGPSVFVDNTIVGVKNYNLPQNNSKTYTATKCTQCGNNGSQLAKTCTFCIGANHLHPADKPTNTRWGPRPRKSAQPIIVNQSPSDFHKVGAAMRKIPYVEKHHANPQIGHIVYPKTPYRIPRGTAAQLKINDPQRYPGTM